MKIFLPFKIQDTGGTSTFAKKFKEGMEKEGHEVFFEYQDNFDVLFVIVRCPLKYLIEAKKRHKKIIHRLDGMYYWTIARYEYPLRNLVPKIIHKYFSDFTIYQSQYSKHCTDKFLGKRKDEEYEIIYNGVDINLFSPKGEKINLRDNPEQKIFFTASRFRRKDQIIPIIDALEKYKNKYNNNFKLIIAGNFSKEVEKTPEKFSKLPYIEFIGKVENGKLPIYERSADLFLLTHRNPPCPNNVIEAMACGLPVCGFNDGAMPEIVKNGKNGLLADTKGNAFWINREYDMENFSDNLNKIVKNLELFSKNSAEIAAERFSLEQMIKKYISAIENCK